jgi:hypothetical protein
MKMSFLLFAMTTILLGTACSSQPKETATESTPAATTESPVPAPAPSNEGPISDVQACEGKGARDACSYTTEAGEIKGTCVRSETFSLHCLPKKPKKK